MWYKNIAGRFFGLVTKHACDRQTDRQKDRITTPKTALAQLRRAVKTSANCLTQVHLKMAVTMACMSVCVRMCVFH